jgi:two-component system, LytTR family, sensor kinase
MKNTMKENVTILQKIKDNKKVISVHMGIWLLYSICIFVWYSIPFTLLEILDSFLTTCLWMATFYSYHLLILPYFFKNKRWFLLILVYLTIHLVYVILFYGEENFIAFLQQSKSEFNLDSIIRRGSFWHTQFIFIALGYHFYGESIKEKQKMLLIEAELQKTQLILKKSELENLKAQFNPHFLFNSLWYVYALVSEDGNEKATKAVELLATMMRYSMQNRQVNEFVPLEEELNYANNYVELQRLRNPLMQLDSQVNGDLKGTKILPLTLISFVENACKHGKLNEEENPLMIHLTVEENKDVCFFVKNKISTLGRERSSGIGLENVKNRLRTAYGDNQTLEITNDTEFYTSKLSIKS